MLARSLRFLSEPRFALSVRTSGTNLRALLNQNLAPPSREARRSQGSGIELTEP
jgi:hypothetical protein